MNYKIAETFDSIQGEGHHSGTRMYFLRLAGCNVGKYVIPANEELKQLRILHPEYSVCTSALGSEFLCDTDYHGAETLTENQLMLLAGNISIILITGGEPFLWNLQPLIELAWTCGKRVHVETSGTLRIKNEIDWITCAPKKGFLEENYDLVNEWKFLVEKSMGDPKYVAEKISSFIEHARNKRVFIMPVNDIDTISKENSEFAFEVLKHGNALWRLGTQIHKALNFR